MTLIEVVVALTLMATILAGSLMAFSSHRRQLASAEKRFQLTIIADDLLETLTSRPDGLPRNSTGFVPGQPSLRWQTSVVSQTELATLPVHIIRFAIFDSADLAKPALQVDLVQEANSL
ncbi:hypothetical protein LOC67_02780 [Stieleria sp. JC731]|nr:hypothetical protein [Stieleria sp. JC731]